MIAPMAVRDIPAVMEIERDSQLEPWSHEAFLQELHQPVSSCYVARLPERLDWSRPNGGSRRSLGIVIGYICFWTVADEVQILNLATHRSYRRKGVARALLSHALEMGCERNARLALLEVRKSNLAAQHLYMSAGFKSVGERPDYYGVQREPAVLMELQLEDWRKLHWLSKISGATKE